MLSFGNTLSAAQGSAQPKSSFPFYEKQYTYVSPRVFVYAQSLNMEIFHPDLLIYKGNFFNLVNYLLCWNYDNCSEYSLLSLSLTGLE